MARDELSDHIRSLLEGTQVPSSTGSSTSHSYGTSPGINTVPEPATLLLTGVGLLGAAALRRRRTS